MFFNGEYNFLSNFYPCTIPYDGVYWYSVENAYQAAKVILSKDKLYISTVFPAKAKRYSKQVQIDPEWDIKKVDVMRELLQIKFSDYILKGKLYNTGEIYLVENNTWHDNFWGFCVCDKCIDKNKQNILGELLMTIRSAA